MNPPSIKTRIGRLAGDYFTYSRSEQRGIAVLGLILLCVILGNAVVPSGTSQKSPDFSGFTREIREFEAAWQRASDSDSVARTQKHFRFTKSGSAFAGDSAGGGYRRASPGVIIELNSADTLDLQQLRGIGPGFARRIVNYRERLRGYCDKRQVLEVFGMDTARYGSIAGSLRVDCDSIRPFDLNAVTFKELLRHPYFPFAATKNIIVYRQKHKTFKSLEELKNVEGIDDSLFRRMVIYLRLRP